VRPFRRFAPFGIALVTASSLAPSALAQGPADAGADDSSAVVPPRLVRFVKATPPDGSSVSEPTPVLTEITIDESGRVSEATIVESAGEALDQAVLEAVRAFEFEPARRAGTPVAVTIRYRYVLEPPAPEPPPTAPPVALPVPSAPAKPPPKPPAPRPGAAPPDAELDEFGATAEVEAPPREPTRRSLGGKALTRVPGTRGDPVKAIEIMPGVARTIAGGDPLLRGAAWNESRSLLDGVPVPFLFHFGDLASFMHPRLIERVDLYPSNFSARYGGVTGGVVEVRARDPRSDALHGVLDLNLIDSSLLVEGPVGDRTSFAAAARRSNIDFFFETFVPKDAYSVLAAPIYWDYQAMLAHRFDADHRVRLMIYGARDSVDLLFADPVEEDPALAGSVGGSTEFHRVQTLLRSDFSSTASQELVVALSVIDLDLRFGELVQEADGPELQARGEWSFELLPELRLMLGADFSGWFARGSYRGPRPGQTEGDPGGEDPLASQRLVSLELDSFHVIHPGAYLELGFRPFDRLLLVPGVRADYYPALDDVTFDPRFTARFEATRTTTLKTGAGLYSQAPEYYQTLAVIGNPELEPYRAIHTSLGIEQRLGEAFKVGVDGFYKRLENRVVSTSDGAPPYLVNDGEGRIVGGEFSAEWNPKQGTFGYAGYTLSRSERRDLDGAWRPFDQDQTHILTVAAGHELGAGWEVGARFRLVTGNPTTPVVGSVYDARSGVYVPVYGAVNSERNPAFHQLDVRVEKSFRVGTGSVAVYLDLQNAYNRTNQEGIRYSYDFRQQEPVSGLPILPNFGVRGEL
jgi:TonB family protein